MMASGAILREVGTTNRTHPEDYSTAINENTAILMKVHRSNFFMEGFTREVSLRELADMGTRYGITTYYDLGSGALIPLRDLGFQDTREGDTFKEAIGVGIDLVSGSGDKILGGPQAGIIAGKRDLIMRLRKNPLSRALRVDKMTLAGLGAVLRLYLEGRLSEIPVIRMLTEREEVIKRRALRLKRMLKGIEGLEVGIIRELSKPGGGSLPWVEMPTWCILLNHRELRAGDLSKRLRDLEPPIIGRIKDERVLLDMRTVGDDELKTIREALRSINY